MIRHIVIVFAFLLSFTAAVLIYGSPSNDRDQTIGVDVDLVLVNAAVSDSKGRMVMGLQQDNFRIWEDKVEQKVGYFSSEDTPMSIGLVFDATGSMADKISTARDAAASFLRVGNPEDEYFLVTFSQRATLVEPFTTEHLSAAKPYALHASQRADAFVRCGLSRSRDNENRKEQEKSIVIDNRW